MYIGGLKNGSVRANLMTNSHTGKYATLMDLQNDAILRILCGARRQVLHREQEVLILTMVRVKPL